MATWECRECTALYAPGAPACPQCGTNDPVKEAEQLQRERELMPKITVHGGPSNDNVEQADQTDQTDQTEQAEETAETPATGEETETPASDDKPTRGGRRSSRS